MNEPQNYSPRIYDDADKQHMQCNLHAEKLVFNIVPRRLGRYRVWEAEPGPMASAKNGQNDVTQSPSLLPRSPGASLQSVQVCNGVSGARAPFIMYIW